MSAFSPEYSKLYDQIHEGKDYESDINKLTNLLKTIPNFPAKPKILDFGCGTGKHLALLHDLGFEVQGYDPSTSMVQEARKRNPNIKFEHEIHAISSEFDLVISLFDVFSYQISDQEAEIYLSQIVSKLKLNGAAILDFWNLEGVKKDPPQNRTRSFTSFSNKYERVVLADLKSDSRVTDLFIQVKNLTTETTIYSEKHQMRAYEVEEIAHFLGDTAEITGVFDAKDYTSPISSSTWRAGVIIRPLLKI